MIQQIEKLKVSQMEKQLEFKEAATKRKLLVLKQQLQSGNNSSVTPSPALSVSTASSSAAIAHSDPEPRPDVVHTAMMSPSQQDSTTQRYLVTTVWKKPPATAPVKQETTNKSVTKPGVPKSKSDRLAVSVDGRWCTLHSQSTGHGRTGVDSATEDVNKSAAVSPGFLPKSSYKQSSFQSLLIETPRRTGHNQESQKPTDRRILYALSEDREHTAKVSDTTTTKSPDPSSNSAAPNALTLHPNLPEKSPKLETHRENSASGQVSGLITKDRSRSFTQKEPSRENSSSSRSAKDVKNSKLTLPEEIKETEYMSALQRQKARVSRIRRCIAAATVIQRAWRDYKRNQ